jgi:hypothetical protein
MFKYFFPKVVPFFLDNVEKYGTDRQTERQAGHRWQYRRCMHFACWINKATDTHTHTHTHTHTVFM